MSFFEDMLYDGDEMDWYGIGKFKATSGLPGSQTADQQTVKDHGPIPEGNYSLLLKESGTANVVDVKHSVLDAREGIESLVDMPGPDGRFYESDQWGKNRVRLRIFWIKNPKARGRNGFYLHDSTKGFSHGCIEVEPRFFNRLRQMAKEESAKPRGRRHLYLKVEYPSATESTYGGTKVEKKVGTP
jgi:hypothetical protein